MNTSGRWAMAILQIKGIDDALYSRLKQMARREAQNVDRASAEALLALAGSWEDDRDAAEIAREIRASRRNSDRGSLL
jgi:hypothetical protein